MLFVYNNAHMCTYACYVYKSPRCAYLRNTKWISASSRWQ